MDWLHKIFLAVLSICLGFSPSTPLSGTEKKKQGDRPVFSILKNSIQIQEEPNKQNTGWYH